MRRSRGRVTLVWPDRKALGEPLMGLLGFFFFCLSTSPITEVEVVIGTGPRARARRTGASVAVEGRLGSSEPEGLPRAALRARSLFVFSHAAKLTSSARLTKFARQLRNPLARAVTRVTSGKPHSKKKHSGGIAFLFFSARVRLHRDSRMGSSIRRGTPQCSNSNSSVAHRPAHRFELLAASIVRPSLNTGQAFRIEECLVC